MSPVHRVDPDDPRSLEPQVVVGALTVNTDDMLAAHNVLAGLSTGIGAVWRTLEHAHHVAEAMSAERLSIEVRRASGGEADHDGDVIDLEHMDDGTRVIVLRAYGHRWDGVLDGVVAAHGGTRIDEADADE